MSLRTISLALISNGGPDPAAVVRYALDLTGYARAHLLVRIAVPPLIVPTLGYPFPSVGPQIQTMIEQEDVERREWAEQMASMIQMEAEKPSATATVEVLSAAYDSLTPHLIRMARGSDICIMLAPSYAERQQRDILLDLLFGSGGPLLLVPTNWKKRGPARRAVVAWDGSACAARAVRDALPLLAYTESVEVLSVLGEKDIGAETGSDIARHLARSDIARHLARHCREVAVEVLPVGQSGVAATLLARAMLTGADMMVMGGYGHSRLREFVLGGATRDTLARTDIPTLLSH
jgi:nucleotide-binding universal stress UspA family protein